MKMKCKINSRHFDVCMRQYDNKYGIKQDVQPYLNIITNEQRIFYSLDGISIHTTTKLYK
jgi:hypothetical protein